MLSSVPYTLTAEQWPMSRIALGRLPRHLPVHEPQHLELGVDPGQVELHPLLVDHPAAVGQLGVLRPLDDLGEAALHDAAGDRA